MSRNVIETVMGAVVLVIAAVFLFFAYSTSQVRAVSGYPLIAKFSSVEGIRTGGDVRVNGIKVGSIVSETLDPTTYLVTVKLSIDPTIKLPDDTIAEILSSSLLGDSYMALVPGASDAMFKAGGEITHTQAPVSILDMVSKYIFNAGGSPKSGDETGNAAPAPSTPTGAPPPLTAPAPSAEPAAPKP